MKIAGFVWFEDIVQKLIWKHTVETEEVREIFLNNPRYRFVEKGHRKDENVYAAFGQTDAGRYLVCFFVHKKDNRALILSARDMTDSEKKVMAENKSSISKANSYREIGEFWDARDLGEVWDETEEVNFEVDLQSDVFYYAVEISLSSKLHAIAQKRGVSAETLVNLWLQEKVNQEI